MDNIKFGQFITARRTELGLTQAELADRLHVTYKAVSKWETGKGFPDIQLLEPLAKALDVTVMELIQEQKELEPLTGRQTDEVLVEVMQDSANHTGTRIFRAMKWVLFIVGLIFAGLFLPEFLWLLTTRTAVPSSIGVIGGADGPTAIYVSTVGADF